MSMLGNTNQNIQDIISVLEQNKHKIKLLDNLKKTERTNATPKPGGYALQDTGKKICDMERSSSKGNASGNVQETSNWLLMEKCIINSYGWTRYGRDEDAYYHEEVFIHDRFSKFQHIVKELWQNPKYDGYITAKGILLRYWITGIGKQNCSKL